MKIAFTNNNFVGRGATLYIHLNEIARVRDELGIWVKILPVEEKVRPNPKKINASGFFV